MHRQVGDLVIINGRAVRGLLVRHLVLPYDLSGTKQVMQFIGREISTNTYVNIMDQYRPCGQAFNDDSMNRGVTGMEFQKALKAARKAGLDRLN
jgi:putative pyruvate formate lyase activating enzyme